MATLVELEELYEQIRPQYTDDARIVADLLNKEIKRRKGAGRPAKSKLTKTEQNRQAQQRFRNKKKGLTK